MSYIIQDSFLEYPDNESVAVAVYLTGCSNNCVGCHNPELQKWDEIDKNALTMSIKERLKRLKTNKIVLLGGDPLYEKNIPYTKHILNTFTECNICIYTGYSISYVKELKLSNFTFIKSGIFDSNFYIGSKKTNEYIQFSTSNQELLNNNLEVVSKNGRYYF